MPEWAATVQTSDWILFAIAIALLIFTVDYGGFTPWWKSPLGWIIFGYGLSMVMFTGLILYAVITGERAPEVVRIPVMIFVLTMIVGKEVMLQILRREGRIERRRLRQAEDRVSSASTAPTLEGHTPMTEISPTVDEIKDVSTIWFRTQRALRTAFSTFITILPLAPQVIAIVNGQWESEFLVAVGIQAVALNAVVSRIMAIPTVNAFLTKWLNLGSIPKQNIRAEINPSSGNMVVAVLPDTKALK
ncbi:membrane protein [Microbacterium phage Squash]|uniref:Uncharacterized protein n=1 Tax=Microbacterium phage Squash TaxID=2182357 RepID=A0A2U8ULY7_9CAUD|nr:membrane protein [Microbacterium phage Squash]AWN04665.1 hypothetical protein PBI_SQUASH_46 [Microbacterium phage Squash]